MAIYGRNANSGEQDVAQTGADQMLLCVFDPATSNLWIYAIECYLGKPTSGTSTPGFEYALYDTNSSRDPVNLRGLTENLSTTVVYGFPTGGSKKTGSIVSAPGSPSNAAVKWNSGARAAIGVNHLSGGTLNISMTQAADLPSGTDNYSFYRITNSSEPPESDLESNDYTESYEGHLTICAVADINSAPLAPASLSPTGDIQTVTPNFQGSFRDSNGSFGTDRGDVINRIRIKVYTDLAGTNNIWNYEAAANSTEQANDLFDRPYLGAALSRGTTYYWKSQVSDQFGAWSPETAMQSFTPVSLGVVTLDADPTGKVDDLTPDFEGKWFHGDGLSTNAVQIQLWRGGALLYESAIISKTVASSGSPGTEFTITAAEHAFAQLDPGQTFEYAIRGRDTNNQWSTYQTTRRSFNTDYAPTVPTRVSPANGAIVSTLPELSMKSTDQDDTVGTGFVGYMRIKTKENFDNPAFGSNITSWELHAANSVTASVSHEASIGNTAAGSIRFNVTAGASPNEYQYRSADYLPVVAGESYSFQMSARKDHATDIDVRIGVRWLTGAGAEISTAWGSYGPDIANTFQALSFTGTAPATAERAQILSGVKCMVTIGTARNAYFDDVVIPNPQTRFIRAATQDGDNWEYTPTGTDVPSVQQVWWDGYTYDGTVYSGGSPTTPQYMTEASFIYAIGPTVTVTAPTVDQVLTTNRPTFDWNDVTDQTHYRIQAWLAGTETSVWDSGWVASASSGPVQAPAGYFHNELEYDYTISVRDNLSLEGSSALRSFSVSLTPPATLTNATMVPIAIGLSPWADTNRISFDQSLEPDFWSYVITRHEWGAPETTAIVLFESFEVTDTTFLDKHPASGKEYVYRLYQTINVNGDYIESDPVEFIGVVTITGISLVDVNDISGLTRVSFEFYEDLAYQHNDEDNVVLTWGKRKPRTIRSAANFWEVPVKVMIVTTPNATAEQVRLALKNIVENGSGVYSYRDDAGEVYFVAIDACKITTEEYNWYTAQIAFREEDYTEGVV